MSYLFLSSLKVLLTLLRKVGQVQGEGHEFEIFLRTGTTSIEHWRKSSNRMLCLFFFLECEESFINGVKNSARD